MGLLDKVGAARVDRDTPGDPESVMAAITGFYHEAPLFHCVVLRHGGGKGFSGKIEDMAACHGAVCENLSDGNCLVLLPGDLDMELFSHRISKSTGSTVAFQFTSDSPSAAFDALYSRLS
ncbi:MAG: hypothetical protein FWB79_00805 [Treponema sp.]|nr:hypothetical protein [Treponema sp.]